MNYFILLYKHIKDTMLIDWIYNNKVHYIAAVTIGLNCYLIFVTILIG